MKKLIILGSILLSMNVSSICQIRVHTEFHPISYDEVYRVYAEATQAYNQNLYRFEDYYEKAMAYYNNQNYDMAEWNFENCKNLNNRWNFIDKSIIEKNIQACQNMKLNQKKFKELEYYWQQGVQKYNQENYLEAKEYFSECNKINSTYSFGYDKAINDVIVDCRIKCDWQQGIQRFNQERYSEAKDYFSECARLNTTYNFGYDKVIDDIINECNRRIKQKEDMSKFQQVIPFQGEIHTFKGVNYTNFSKRTNRPSYTTPVANSLCKITRILQSKSETRVEFEYVNNFDAEGWCSINSMTKLIEKETGKQLILKRVEGIKITPQKTIFSYKGEVLYFALIFDALSQNAKTIDIIEEDINSPWKFLNISLN
ncbi:MAG: hypothetical protein IJ759_07020 [Bacteroidales bacterium]|nr:hypothetical protein [Bacteroidales bacterium]